jgi:hypothetical protein
MRSGILNDIEMSGGGELSFRRAARANAGRSDGPEVGINIENGGWPVLPAHADCIGVQLKERSAGHASAAPLNAFLLGL